MKTKLLLLVAPALFFSSCEKSPVGRTPKNVPQASATSAGDLEELMKLPDSPRMMNLWVNHREQEISTDAFDMAPPKIVVKKVSKDLFEVNAVYEATAKTDLYSASVPTLVDENGKTMSYMVTRLLDRKGTKKISTFRCQVRYGPMNWGRNPQKVMWNWENSEEGGDKMEIYKRGGPPRWAPAETLKINSDGQSSSDPEILILDTPDYHKAVEKHPKLAVGADQRAKEEAEKFDRILEAMPRRSH